MSNDAGTLTAYAEDLIPGARNAVRTCLRVKPGESVAIVTDRETEEIAASLADQVREVDGAAEVLVMEDYGPRPMLALPTKMNARSNAALSRAAARANRVRRKARGIAATTTQNANQPKTIGPFTAASGVSIWRVAFGIR